jgi:hypothetical protein
MHLVDPGLPSVEGLLVRTARREYHLAVPRLVVAAGGEPVELENTVVIPRERVAFYEVVSP